MRDNGETRQLPEYLFRGPLAAPRFVAPEPAVRSGRDPFAGYFHVYRWERRIVVRGAPEAGAWEEYKCFPRAVYADGTPVAIVWCRLEQIPAARDLVDLAALLGAATPLSVSADADATVVHRYALHP